MEESDVPPELGSEIERRIEAGECFECKRPGAELSRFMRVTSFAIWTSHRRWEEFVCPSCKAKRGARELAISGALGWWGIPWGILTFQAIFVNIRTLLRSTALGKLLAVFLLPVMLTGAWLLGGFVVAKAADYESRRRRGDLLSQDAHMHMERGDLKYEAGDVGTALLYYEAALRHAPDSLSVRTAVAVTLHELGRPAEALPHFERVLRREPGLVGERGYYATCLEMSGEFPAALEQLKQCVADTGAAGWVHRAHQRVAITLGERASVERSYRERAAKRPGHPEALYLAGCLLRNAHERAAAMRRVLGSEPGHHDARAEWIRCLIEMHDLAGAEQALAGLDGSRFDPAELAAELALARGEYEEVARQTEAFLQRWSIAPWPRYLRAEARALSGRVEEAYSELAALEESTRAPADWFWIRARRANYLMGQARLDDAREAIREARESIEAQPPEHETVLAELEACRLWQTGDEGAALRILESAPRNVDGYSPEWEVALDRALLLFLTGATMEARPELETLAAMGDEWKPEAARAASMLLGRSSPSAYLASVEKNPRYRNDAWFHVGIHHEFAGRFAEAKKAYAEAVRVSLGGNFPRHHAAMRLAKLEAEEKGR